MGPSKHLFERGLSLASLILALFFVLAGVSKTAQAQASVTNDPPFYGPFNVVLLPDGDGVKKLLLKDDSVLRADSLVEFPE